MLHHFLRYKLLALLLTLSYCGSAQTLAHITKAEKFLAEAKLDKASSELEIAAKVVAKETPAIRAHYFLVKGKLHKQYSEIGKALASYKKAEVYYLKKRDNDSVLLVKTLKAEVFRFGMLEKESLDEIHKAQNYLTKSCSPNIHAYFLNRKLAIYNYWLFEKDRAAIDDILEELLALQDKITDYETMAYTLNEQGNIVEKGIGQVESIPYYEKAFEYAIQHKQSVAGADIAINIGRLYQNQTQFHKAIEAYFKGVELAKKTNNIYQLSRLYQGLSFCHEFINDLKGALNYRDTSYGYATDFNLNQSGVELQKIERRYNLNLKEKELKLKNTEIEQFQSRYLYMLLIIGIIAVITVILVINHRRTLRTNKKLDKLSKENEFLLREANHRIHNNLQLIIILINSELNKGSGEMENQLIKLQSQVDSIATLHKHLYQTDDKRTVNMVEYIREIKINLNDHFVSKNVQVDFDIPDFKVATDQAMQIGLIITEMCINTLKHAFSDTQENRHVYLHMEIEKQAILVTYKDNGDQLNGKEIKPKLISQLLRQLKAEVDLDTKAGYHIQFKINR
jgi:two-component sensor histidine kinase/tetratricopeptide (TPR) repeat protein